MTKYLKIMLTITLFFGLCTTAIWYGLSHYAGDYLSLKINEFSRARGYVVSIDEIEVRPAGLISLHDLKLRPVKSKTDIFTIGTVECTFRPLELLSGRPLEPTCHAEAIELNEPATSLFKRAQTLYKNRLESTSQPSADVVSGAGKYVAPLWNWTWIFRWNLTTEKALKADGLLVYSPPVAPLPAKIQGSGNIQYGSDDRAPYFVEAEFQVSPLELKHMMVGFPKTVRFSNQESISLELWRANWSPPEFTLNDLSLKNSGDELYAEKLVLKDRKPLQEWIKGLLGKRVPPGGVELHAVRWLSDNGLRLTGEYSQFITTAKGTSATLENTIFFHPEHQFTLNIPTAKLSPVTLKRWRKTLADSDLLITSPSATFGLPNDSSQLDSSLHGRIKNLISLLLRGHQKSGRDEEAIEETAGSIPLSEAPVYLPRTTITNGSLFFASKSPEGDESREGIRRVSASWKKVGNEGLFEISANLDNGQQEQSAANLVGAYHFYKGRLMRLKARTSNTLFPQLLKEASSKFVIEDSAEVSLNLDLDMAHPSLWFIKGKVNATGLGFDWWRIAPTPVENLSFMTSIEASFDRTDRRFTLTLPDLRISQADLSLKLVLENLGFAPLVDLTLNVPKQPCSFAFGAIPDAMIPRLRNLRVAGDVEMGLKLKLDSADPYSLKLDIESDLESCTVLRLGDHMEMSKLRDPTFIHRPYVEGEELQVEVGPGTPSWVPFYRIPSYVAMAAVATEDLDFFVHEGFKVSLIRRAMKLNLDKERYVYGGSTISQQLVKNLFLSREKNLSRKLEEAILTWQMEREIDKLRILELYLNCIEYGPGIYGLANGSFHYFNKSVNDLTPLEGAFLMGLKPCPSCGFRQWKRKGVNKRWRSKLEFIMNRLYKRGWITEKQFAAGAPYMPEFKYDHLSDIIGP